MDKQKNFTKKYPPSTLIHILFFVTSLFIIFYAFLDLNALKSLLQEDGLVENTQALLYLLGSIVWIYAFIIFRPETKIEKRRRLFYLLFMGFFLFLFLEEISYGQRLFGFTTPDSLREINLQDETNIHNIGSESTVLLIHILHALLLAILGIVIPFLNLVSKRFSSIFKRINFPIVNTNLIVCFGISLNFYYEPGFHWSVPLRIISLLAPIIIVFSGRFRWLFSHFKYPLFQISILAITGFLMIALNLISETNQYIENFFAWETRELFIAMSLFFFAAFEVGEVLRKRNKSNKSETPSQTNENATA
jgi:hypothetical protein